MFISLSYVDKYRSFATKIGGGTEDLKEAILTSGFVHSNGRNIFRVFNFEAKISLLAIGLTLKTGSGAPDDPSDQMYLKQAQHLIRIGRY